MNSQRFSKWAIFLSVFCFLSLVGIGCDKSNGKSHSNGGQPKLPAKTLQIGEHSLATEIADTPQTMRLGLMFRSSLGENEGMLFVFPEPRQASFWMRNTYLPLSIAYIDSHGRILEMYDMQPLDETSIVSASDQILYALEVNQGWFKNRNIQIGAQIQGLPNP